MLCPHCQHEIPDRAVYCGACGRRVIGWRGQTDGEGGRPAADSNVETQPIPPDPRLLEAAGADPATTRKIAPDSHLLRIVRGEPAETRQLAPDSRLLRSAGAADSAAPTPPAAASQPPAPAPPPMAAPPTSPPRADPTEQVSPMPGGTTSYAMAQGLQRGPSRLWLLLGADGVLLVVGIYLIASWAARPARRSAPPPGPPPTTHGMSYIDWNTRGGGRIATGPVQATFAEATRGMALALVADAGVMAAPPRPRPSDAMRPPPRTPEPRPLSRIRLAPPPMVDDVAQIARRRAAFLKSVPGRVRREQQRIRQCYQQVLRLIKTVRGDLDIEFMVAADGRVTVARAHRNTTGSKSLASCIVGVFLSLRLPRPPGGKVTLRYPFRFAPRT